MPTTLAMAARHIVDNVCRGSPLPRARLRAKAATATPATASTPAQNIQWFASVIANGRASSSSVQRTPGERCDHCHQGDRTEDGLTHASALAGHRGPDEQRDGRHRRSKPDWPSHMSAGPGPSLDVRTMGRTPLPEPRQSRACCRTQRPEHRPPGHRGREDEARPGRRPRAPGRTQAS